MLGHLGSEYAPIFENGVWENLTTPGTGAYHYLWGPLIVYEIVGNLFFAIGAIVLVVLFFTKNHRFPLLMIGFLVLNPVFVILDHFLGNLIPFVADMGDTESYAEIGRAVIGAMIWVPYFMVSKRVKNTFVKPGLDKNTLEAFD